MNDRLRFAEAVCVGHPDRLADTIAGRIVALATARDPDALVGVEVALHRNVVFVDGRVAAGREEALVGESEIVALVREAFRDAGYGRTPSGVFPPDPDTLDVRTDLCLGALAEDERAIRDVSDDQAICVGHAVWGPRAGHRPLEQALASDFAAVLERVRVERPELGLGPDGKTLVAVRGRRLVGVSLSVQHAQGVDWVALTREVRAACEAVAAEYVAAGELEPLGPDVDWLVNGAGAFEVGGPEGDNGLSGKKLVAQAYGTAVPIWRGGDPREGPPQGGPPRPGPRASDRPRRRLQGWREGGDGLADLPARRPRPRLDRDGDGPRQRPRGARFSQPFSATATVSSCLMPSSPGMYVGPAQAPGEGWIRVDCRPRRAYVGYVQ
jgi:S-adenosylmethionine synthetase